MPIYKEKRHLEIIGERIDMLGWLVSRQAVRELEEAKRQAELLEYNQRLHALIKELVEARLEQRWNRVNQETL